MDQQQLKDNALFEQLDARKKKRRRKVIRTVIIVLLLLALLLTSAVIILRKQVRERFASASEEVISYQASLGSISTSISGSGTLSDVDLEALSVPAGVEIEEVFVEANSKIRQGQLIASVNMASVMTAMSQTQEILDELDEQLEEAEDDDVSRYISSGIYGRVKKIFAQTGDSVAQCIYDYGALALISLDGYMAVDIESDTLASGDSVKLLRADGTEISGTVERSVNNTATVLVSDRGPEYQESVTVLDSEGNELGSGQLYIHSPLRVTGITGSISRVNCYEDQTVYSGSTLFTLSNTGYSTGFEALLRERGQAEELMFELMELYSLGALYAPYGGSISSLDYDESSVTEDSATQVVTISPDESMSVTINVDESDILSLELGQQAQISVASIGEDVFIGQVTEINKTASSSSGVTRYSAVIQLPKSEGMLPGMTASVVVRISGVDNAVIIPIEALHQTSASSYVYTGYDEESGQFSGMVQVVTGISNSSYVEIISGLNQGDTVWYTEEERGFSGFGSFGGGMPSGFGGSGEMPSGFSDGDMPSGFSDGDMPSGFGGGERPDFGGGMPSGFGG